MIDAGVAVDVVGGGGGGIVVHPVVAELGGPGLGIAGGGENFNFLADELCLLGITDDIELADDHFEGCDVLAMVEEYGPHAVEINDVISLSLVAEIRGEVMDSFAGDGQLQLMILVSISPTRWSMESKCWNPRI